MGEKKATEAFSEVTSTFGQFMKASKQSVGNRLMAFGSNVGNSVSNYFKTVNDNVLIPKDTQTLLGEDFASLYTAAEYELITDNTGVSVEVLKPSCSYETEMHSMGLSFSEPTLYADLPEETRVAYEMILLSKKYASEYTGDQTTDEQVGQKYAEYMSKYADYCNQHDISFTEMLGRVSAELQTETRDYLKEDKQLLSDDSWTTTDRYRVNSNRAHNWVAKCGETVGYQDSLIPALSDDITLADTQDEKPKYNDSTLSKAASNSSMFLVRLGMWFKEKFKNFIQGVKDVKSVTIDAAKDTANKIVARSDADTEARNAEIAAKQEQIMSSDASDASKALQLAVVGHQSMTLGGMMAAVTEGMQSGLAGVQSEHTEQTEQTSAILDKGAQAEAELNAPSDNVPVEEEPSVSK